MGSQVCVDRQKPGIANTTLKKNKHYSTLNFLFSYSNHFSMILARKKERKKERRKEGRKEGKEGRKQTTASVK